jgi:hypothetical protein
MTLFAPLVEVRAVKPFPPQKGADLAMFRACIGFSENAQLVFGGEPAPLGLRHHFRIRGAGYVGRLAAITTW